MRVLVCGAAIALAACLTAPPLRAASYMPLVSGMSWDYRTPSGLQHNMMMCGTRVVNGAVTSVRHQSEVGQVYENYWTEDAAGNLYLHGAWNVTSNYQAVYAPPILFVHPPLSVGRTWANPEVHMFDFDGNDLDFVFSYPMAVFTDETLTVPAGAFHAYGIGFDPSAFSAVSRSGGAYSLIGRRLDTAAGATSAANATDWFSEGVGEVRFSGDGELFGLVGWGAPTPVAVATWGAIKALYASGVQSH